MRVVNWLPLLLALSALGCSEGQSLTPTAQEALSNLMPGAECDAFET